MLGLEANDATPNHTSAVHYGSLALLLRHIFLPKLKTANIYEKIDEHKVKSCRMFQYVVHEPTFTCDAFCAANT